MQAYLLLEDGTVFPGTAFGAHRESVGEMVFTTAMTGYLETLTDPSYFGQIVVQTFPLIGNYGIIPSDFESPSPRLSAYIVRQWCQDPSNFRSEGRLDAFLSASGIPGLSGVDTRRLTRWLRSHGPLNGKLLYNLPSDLAPLLRELSAYRVTGAVAAAGGQRLREFPPPGPERHRIALWDFGAKQGIVRALLQRDCRVFAVPASASAEEILALRPDGILLSNGPGDPAENQAVIRELSILCQSGVPIFGICLGHQLLALSQGASTEKLRYGHRGANQPVRDLSTGRVYITSQNHGYAVRRDSLPAGAREWFQNANDQTNEGLEYTHIPACSVQFHPEACGGPHDTMFLFDRFLERVAERKEKSLCR